MMRIGIDATALPARLFGAGNYIVNLIQALARVDHANAYTAFTKPLHRDLFASLERVEVVDVPLSGRIPRIAWEQTTLPRLARDHRLDLLHSPHYTVPLRSPCPTVVTFHDMTFFLYPQVHLAYKRLFFRSMMPLSARRAAAIITISESTCRDVTRILHIPPERVHTIAYGVAAHFRPETPSAIEAARRKFRLPAEFVVYVGNLEPRKNLPRLLEAFSQLVRSGLPHSLVLVGSRGWKDQEVFATCKQVGLDDRVMFLGFVPQEELAGIYGASRGLVYPSLYEGFGLPVLEAMACGTPVITSNVSSMPEVAGDTGILVDPTNVTELRDALYRLLTDDALHATLARKALERSKLFSWERTAEQTLQVYERACLRK